MRGEEVTIAGEVEMKADNDAAAEHHIQMPESGRQADMAAAAAPEKWLNRFVRSAALIERVGNALGTLAFTWATVILLGGYPTELRSKDDFKFATIIVFLEAARYICEVIYFLIFILLNKIPVHYNG